MQRCRGALLHMGRSRAWAGGGGRASWAGDRKGERPVTGMMPAPPSAIRGALLVALIVGAGAWAVYYAVRAAIREHAAHKRGIALMRRFDELRAKAALEVQRRRADDSR